MFTGRRAALSGWPLGQAESLPLRLFAVYNRGIDNPAIDVDDRAGCVRQVAAEQCGDHASDVSGLPHPRSGTRPSAIRLVVRLLHGAVMSVAMMPGRTS